MTKRETMKVITLRIDAALAERLKTLAWEQRTSMNKLLTRLVWEAVRQGKGDMYESDVETMPAQRT